MNRRTFLKGATLATIVAVDGELWSAFGQSTPEYPDGPAFEPWKTWREDVGDRALRPVRAAILTANAFNTQPWLFKVSESQIELFADTRRNLGAFDPFLRELHFSVGCALENLMLAARAEGYDASESLIPAKLVPIPAKPLPELVARVGLSPGEATRGELYEAIPHRHTNREPFIPDRLLDQRFLSDLRSLAQSEKDVKLFLFTDLGQRQKLVDSIIASSQMLRDPNVQKGTRPWFRATMDAWQKNPDGSYIGPGSPSVTSLEQYRALMLSGPLFGLIGVRDRYDRQQTISAGRLWQRAHLLATARKVAARPANGAVETIDYEHSLNEEPKTAALLARIIGDASWQPTFMFYMGYPTILASASARRSVGDVIV